MASTCGSSSRLGCKLRVKGTFIEVTSDQESLSPRALSDPGTVTCGSASHYDIEDQYVEALTGQMSQIWAERSQGDSQTQQMFEESETSSVSFAAVMPSLPAGGIVEEGGGLDRPKLRSHIRYAANEVEKNLTKSRRRAVLDAIQEIPEQVSGALQQSAMDIVNDISGEVALVKDMIGDSRHAPADEQKGLGSAVAKLEVIPEMIQDSFEAYFSRAERTVRARVDDMIQNLEASDLSKEQVVRKMSDIPSEVQEIAKQAMQAAVVVSRVQAQHQIDCALAFLPNSGARLLADMAEERIIPQVPIDSTNVEKEAKNAVVGTVEHVVAVVRKEDRKIQGVTNQVVAETLLRAKVEGSDAAVASMPPLLVTSTNEGSVGHPELCSRPCLYFARGDCVNGVDCNFCHMEHSRRPVHPDKKNRQVLKEMPYAECVAVLSPILRDKIKELDLGQEMLKELESFAESVIEGAKQVPAPEPVLSGRRRKQLQEFVYSMTLRSVMALLMRAAPTAVQRDAVEEFTQRLRGAADRR